jgi:hypothetical protein
MEAFLHRAGALVDEDQTTNAADTPGFSGGKSI